MNFQRCSKLNSPNSTVIVDSRWNNAIRIQFPLREFFIPYTQRILRMQNKGTNNGDED